jgi:septation ring formation regulator EzrA
VLFRQLEERRSQVAFSERKVAAVESHLAELAQASDEVDRRLHAISEREVIVSAVRREVEAVHAVSARSREDLDYLAGQRDEVTRLRTQVQHLLDTAAETEEKIATIESRRRSVDEVQAKAGMIANLLADVQLDLDAMTEQKAVVAHVAEQLAGIQFVSQEAAGLLRALAQERELAQRIAASLQQLRSRPSDAAGRSGSGAA